MPNQLSRVVTIRDVYEVSVEGEIGICLIGREFAAIWEHNSRVWLPCTRDRHAAGPRSIGSAAVADNAAVVAGLGPSVTESVEKRGGDAGHFPYF